MRVLVIAPEVEGLPRLAQTSELTRLGDVDGIDVQPLTGPLVTQDRIQQRLRHGRFFAVLWSGHGAGGRLLLPGGQDVEPRWMASELKRAGVRLLVLAVCESGVRKGVEGWADVIPDAGIHLVAMSSNVSDVAAIDYDVALLHSLAAGDPVREAHRIGLEALSGQDIKQPQLFASEKASTEDLAGQMGKLRKAMANGRSEDALEIVHQCQAILGDIEVQLVGLSDRVRAIENRLDPPWQVRLWQTAAALVVLMAFSLFFVYQTRELLFNPWYVGAAFETTLLALALVCWRMSVVTMERLR